MSARDEIDVKASDWRPWAVEDRAVVLAAIDRAAAANDGEVHITDVRAHLAREVDPNVVGAVMCALVRQRVLVATGEYRPNGGTKSRNGTKPAAVRRLVRPVPIDTAA